MRRGEKDGKLAKEENRRRGRERKTERERERRKGQVLKKKRVIRSVDQNWFGLNLERLAGVMVQVCVCVCF